MPRCVKSRVQRKRESHATVATYIANCHRCFIATGRKVRIKRMNVVKRDKISPKLLVRLILEDNRSASVSGHVIAHLSLHDVVLEEARQSVDDREEGDGEHVQSGRLDAASPRRVVRSAHGQVAVDRHQHRQVDGARLGDDRRRIEVLAGVRQHRLEPRQSQRVQLQQSNTRPSITFSSTASMCSAQIVENFFDSYNFSRNICRFYAKVSHIKILLNISVYHTCSDK